MDTDGKLLLQKDTKIIKQSIKDLFAEIRFDVKDEDHPPSEYYRPPDLDATLEKTLDLKLKTAVDDRSFWMNKYDQLLTQVIQNQAFINDCESQCVHFVNKMEERAGRLLVDLQQKLESAEVNCQKLQEQNSNFEINEKKMNDRLKKLESEKIDEKQKYYEEMRKRLQQDEKFEHLEKELVRCKRDNQILEQIVKLSEVKFQYLEKNEHPPDFKRHLSQDDVNACRSIISMLQSENEDAESVQSSPFNSTENVQNLTIYKTDDESEGEEYENRRCSFSDKRVSQAGTFRTYSLTEKERATSSVDALRVRRNGVLLCEEDVSKFAANNKTKKGLFSKSHSKE
ncbi:unnamed protein product [Dimorphilus gyrociliatus]|uniref:Uncharacterized protein n=1 Tax=Dimorphilus gyrociliatus TaxID=2664684 RepID=A0A7I8VJV7_9ANNE|nr:unnamed protein product [Dimorphilus gyrociliatus]